MVTRYEQIVEQAVSGLREDRGGLRGAREFTVYAESELAARRLLRSKKGVRMGAVYRTPAGEVPDPFVVCVGLNIDPQGNGAPLGGKGVYVCRAEYAVEDNDGSRKRPEVGGPPVYTIEASLQSVPVDIDLDGKPITNSADEPFDNASALLPNEILRVDWFVKGERNALQKELRGYTGKVNSAEWNGAPRGCFLSHPFTIDEKSSGEVEEAGEDGAVTVERKTLFLVTGRFQYSPPKELFGTEHEGWLDVRQDRGRRQWLGTLTEEGGIMVKKYQVIKDKDGAALTEPVALNGSGAQAASGADPVVKTFRHYDYIDFSALGI